MSGEELTLVFSIGVLIGLILTDGISSKDPHQLFSPLPVFALFFLFYFLLGPLIAVANDNTFFVGRDFRSLFVEAWLAGFVSLLAIWFGYSNPVVASFSSRPFEIVNLPRFVRIGQAFLLFGVVSTLVWLTYAGVVLNIFGTTIGGELAVDLEQASRVNYFYHGMNLVFIGTFMLLAADAIPRSLAVAALLFITLVFVAIGFRYRLLIIFGCAFILWFLRTNRRPHPAFILVLAVFAFVSFGLIGQTRSYFSGLDLAAVADVDSVDVALGVLSETNIFFSFAALLDAVPNSMAYKGLDAVKYVFILPIPRFLWEAKPFPDYLAAIPFALGTKQSEGAGSATPLIAEFYLAYGWIGMVIGSLAVGVVARIIWTAFVASRANIAMQVTYALMAPFFLYAMSRGYLAQVVQDFMFLVAPALVAFVSCSRRVKGFGHRYRWNEPAAGR